MLARLYELEHVALYRGTARLLWRVILLDQEAGPGTSAIYAPASTDWPASGPSTREGLTKCIEIPA